MRRYNLEEIGDANVVEMPRGGVNRVVLAGATFVLGLAIGMLEQGLIEELRENPDPDNDDERRRHYRVTRLGRDVAVAEARRLQDMLSQARATGLIPRKL